MMTAILLSAVSCQDSLSGSGCGYLSANVGKDESLILKSVTAPGEEMIFSLSVYRKGQLVATVDDYRTLAEQPLELPAATYRVVASSGENAEAAIESPYYEGETEVRVPAGGTAHAEIVCALANVKVTAAFDDLVRDKFTEYSVSLCNSSTQTVVLGNLAGTEDKAAYIRADGILKWELALRNTDGKTSVVSGVFEDVKPRQYYALSFTVEETPQGDKGALVARITIDESMTEKDYDFVLDFSDSEILISSNDGFDISSDVLVPVGDAGMKQLSVSSSKGIRSLIFDLSGAGGEVYDLVGATASEIASLRAIGISASSLSEGTPATDIIITDYVRDLPVGDYLLRISVYDMLNQVGTKEILISVLSDVEAEAVSAVPWAAFAIFEGKWYNRQVPDGLTFSYRKVSESSWTEVDPSILKFNPARRTFSAEVYNLDPETVYEFRTVTSVERDGDAIRFTTDKAGDVYNLSFDDWWQNGDVWYPYASDANPTVWDTANGGTKLLNVYPTVPEDNIVAVAGSGKRAARLESKTAAGNLAAGNIYTGKFIKANLSPVGANLEWGLSFTSRPLALKGYCDYRPVDIDYAKDPYSHLKGTQDVAQIQILLTDWSGPFQIDTGNKVFVNAETDPGIIAYGAMDVTATAGYSEFTIPVVYRDLSRTPKYIVIVGAASKYGDYFTGGKGSVLYLDEFRLVYDPSELTEEQRQKVNYRQ